MDLQIRSIEEMSLTELFAIKEEQGDNTSEAVLAAIEEKQTQAPAVNKTVVAALKP